MLDDASVRVDVVKFIEVVATKDSNLLQRDRVVDVVSTLDSSSTILDAASKVISLSGAIPRHLSTIF